MAIVTGANGEMRYNNIRVAKCREFSLDVSKDALETTTLGSYDRTYTEGLRGATGTATILYDEYDATTTQLLNSILTSSNTASLISLVLNTSTNKKLVVSAFLTQVGVPVSVGEVTACSVSFQVSGPVDGTF